MRRVAKIPDLEGIWQPNRMIVKHKFYCSDAVSEELVAQGKTFVKFWEILFISS